MHASNQSTKALLLAASLIALSACSKQGLRPARYRHRQAGRTAGRQVRRASASTCPASTSLVRSARPGGSQHQHHPDGQRTAAGAATCHCRRKTITVRFFPLHAATAAQLSGTVVRSGLSFASDGTILTQCARGGGCRRSHGAPDRQARIQGQSTGLLDKRTGTLQ